MIHMPQFKGVKFYSSLLELKLVVKVWKGEGGKVKVVTHKAWPWTS